MALLLGHFYLNPHARIVFTDVKSTHNGSWWPSMRRALHSTLGPPICPYVVRVDLGWLDGQFAILLGTCRDAAVCDDHHMIASGISSQAL